MIQESDIFNANHFAGIELISNIHLKRDDFPKLQCLSFKRFRLHKNTIIIFIANSK